MATKLRRVSDGSTTAAHFNTSAHSKGNVHPFVKEHFDSIFYISEYEDLQRLSRDEGLEHFWEIGWLEGRNPNLWFDTASYLEMNPDVRDAGVNPLMHYVGWGRDEARRYRAPIPLKRINATLFKNPHIDWVQVVKSVLDEQFYLTQFKDRPPANLTLAAHYAFRGWKLGLIPFPGYLPSGTASLPAEFSHVVPPLVFDELAPRITDQEKTVTVSGSTKTVYETPVPLPFAPGISEAEYKELPPTYEEMISSEQIMSMISNSVKGTRTESPDKDSAIGDEESRQILADFDPNFYLSRYPDVKEAGVDPLIHFYYTGWREGRDPSSWFSTSFYINAYPDVAAAKINPFWHYVVAGKSEGRLGRKQGGAKRIALENLRPPERRADHYEIPEHNRLSTAELENHLRQALKHRKGVLWSISHDCYPLVTGGTQIFISDEQALMNANGWGYVHASPLKGSLLIEDTSPDTSLTRLVIDGDIVGVVTDRELAHVVSLVSTSLPGRRAFVIHSTLGHNVNGLLEIWRSFQPDKSFFWLHDYSSLCSGFNLLRNDVQYCGAPPLTSEACTVCIYGRSRALQLSRLTKLFDACRFEVVAPSEVARSVWLRASGLPCSGSLIVEHCSVEKVGVRFDERRAEEIGLPGKEVRVAFVGYPTLPKGWPTFERIVEEARNVGGYLFYHFAASSAFTHASGIKQVEVSVSRDGRDTMISQLGSHKIDLVVFPAIWPETFSYVTFESLAAGSDIVTLRDSGNVGAAVSRSGRGIVFDSEDELLSFFVLHRAVAYVRARANNPNPVGKLIHKGTTAAIVFNSYLVGSSS